MTRYFITRHPGAMDWARKAGLVFDVHYTHLHDISHMQAGDVVAGTLPINIVADLQQRGVRYLHLSLNVRPEFRGVELNAQQLYLCGARLEEFMVTRPAAPKTGYVHHGGPCSIIAE